MKAASGTFGSARDGCRIVPSKRVRAPAIADIAPRLWLAVSDPHLLRAITDGRIAHTSTQRPNPFAAKGFSFYPREASSRVLDHRDWRPPALAGQGTGDKPKPRPDRPVGHTLAIANEIWPPRLGRFNEPRSGRVISSSVWA